MINEMARKIVCGLILILAQFQIIAQTTTSASNGLWSTATNWQGGVAPGFTGLGATNITINSTFPNYISVGQYGSNQNLTFSANNDSRSITVNGTLVIYGNVDFANMAMDLVIPAGGVVIILGDLDMNNKIDLSLGGTLVVKGDFGKTGSQGSFTGSGGVYAGTYSGNAGALIPPANEFTVNPDLINNPSLQYIEDFLNSNGQNPLPVELLFFKATPAGKKIDLTWATASELNFDYFAVERSNDAKNFTEIGQIKGNGSYQLRSDYQLEDNEPLIGKNYYRLKSVDYDGFVEYFKVVVADYAAEKSFSIAPNPSNGNTVEFFLNFSPDENSKIVVYNSLGMTVGITSATDSHPSLTFNTRLRSGIYYAKLVSKNFMSVERFIVR